MAGQVEQAFEALRRKLIDTTMRNRLLNYRPSRTYGLEVTDEKSESVWRILVENVGTMTFTGPPDPPKKGLDAVEQGELIEGYVPPPPEPSRSVDTEDQKLNTAVPYTSLQRRLLNTYRQAMTQIDEQGINTLFLALGMLEWKESDAAGKTILAPLILVPVSLERSQRGTFSVKHDESDIGSNLSLVEHLKSFGITLPEVPSDLSNFKPGRYYDEIEAVVKDRTGWQVHRDKIVLGFFSYVKSILYQDLKLDIWPEAGRPTHHEDIAATLGSGYGSAIDRIGDDVPIDPIRQPGDAHEIFPADSSQIASIMDAHLGSSMVIEGPPGTGKSQTIANLIGEFVSQGKKVLFVSEKMAALEVVFRRLDEAGLAEACIEIHSQKQSRRAFYEAIKNTWSLRSRLPDATAALDRLTEVRNRLNAYVNELHTPLEPYGVAPRFLIAKSLSLPAISEEELNSGYDAAAFSRKNWLEVEKAQPSLEALQKKVALIGRPIDHPFYASRLEYLGPAEKLNLETKLTAAMKLLLDAVVKSNNLADHLCVSHPETGNDLNTLQHCVEVAASAPPLDGVAVKTGTWKHEAPRIEAAIADLRRFQELRHKRESEVTSSAWSDDLAWVRTAYDQHAGQFLKFLNGDFRRARTHLSSLLTATAPRDPLGQREVVRDVVEVRELQKRIEEFATVGQRLFGVQWQGVHSKPDAIERILRWVLDLEAQVDSGDVPAGLMGFFTGQFNSEELRNEANEAAGMMKKAIEAVRELEGLLKLETESSPEDRPLSELTDRLDKHKRYLPKLSEIIEWNLLKESAQAAGLESEVSLAESWPLSGSLLSVHVMRQWLNAGVKRAYEERSAIRTFERQSHEETIQEFKRLDDVQLLHNRARVAHAHLQGIPAPGQVGLVADLWRQCNLRRGHRPIRWAFENFAELLLRIKPVAMLSPISVANFLPRIPRMFDVLIFDEASQIKPEDALCAIARAKQVIVVGDTKQMPPTSFFDSLSQDEDFDEDEEYDTTVGKLESVLALYSAAAEPSNRKTDLRWHYRSLHETLIQPSNKLFYGDRLVVFPSPVYATNEAGGELGLRFHYDPNATYDRGAQRKVNRKQAAAVAKAIIKHITDRPKESLLAVAFSKHQQEAIEDALEIERAQNVGLFAEFDQLHPHEPLRVKNLETVQGDERDVIFISIGYGRDEKGQLSMNFGPINQENGGRRLNVLMSRARKRCEIFTSIRSGDIRVDGDKPGLAALKLFLEFAETGVMDLPNPTGKEAESIFEEQVMHALVARGYQVDPQVGTTGFRIDLAVRHPRRPGEYVIGIECDGATYHSARSARDRDKLREQVLVSRNWKLHRIWSTDWWRDSNGCLVRCIEAIDRAIESSDRDEREIARTTDEEEQSTALQLDVWTQDNIENRLKGATYCAWDRPFQLSGFELHALPTEVMARCVQTVVAYEGPIHIDLLVTRLRMSANLGRAGSRIRQSVEEGVRSAQLANLVVRRGEFLYWPEHKEVEARDRSLLANSDRDVRFISPEELDKAILSTLRVAVGASKADIVNGVKQIFGYARTPNELGPAIGLRLDLLENSGTVTFDGLYRLGHSG